MKRIFIIRHGRTEWNLEERFQGANGDSPLLESSKKDCRDLAAFLDHFSFSAVYTSPIKRARRTAEITLADSKKHSKERIIDDENFRELAFGDWEGLTKKQVVNKHPELFAKLIAREDDPRFLHFGVENFAKARERFKTGIIHRIKEINDDENLLIFSHGSIIQLGIKALTGNENISSLKNTSTSILQTTDDEHFTIESYDEVGYLKEINTKGNTTLI
ncbi:histidine phosphatase family protein [Oenococcus oeni]|uniref:Adenosylcobalamin/alpha-ribazole phosphatase n=1 Tax=Oenococcus oeni TaxID=1247 RepID=A0AAQ2UVF9_OENOE|nr:histidine phosphatase family protein [Oenococcus oeni]KGI02063.1 histidine phosphatase [Oenococcus oeni IOEB_C52]SYW00401.1 putative Adenosylcobalamin/alpha-ribazole phosphatase [Oenococcus oeni]SYW07257.1 putative Adenosylcobalamin/alpha-ribazole phosphatase [Oenococcus oeni]SYW07655.1 putative Adenosylcobalamin/alpha-ribazole phosphatase [Oenococcus oeni]VDB98345.1 putative Adenosylcobalamin/alpha-ribazole phosphatase [Oenococcus oeni]